MFSKTTPADAKSTYSVSSTASTLKGADTSVANKWFSSKTPSKDQVPASSSSSTSAKAIHNEAIATYLAFR